MEGRGVEGRGGRGEWKGGNKIETDDMAGTGPRDTHVHVLELGVVTAPHNGHAKPLLGPAVQLHREDILCDVEGPPRLILAVARVVRFRAGDGRAQA